MNFKNIFKMQKELDLAIAKAHNVTQTETVNQKILALTVEVSEFANELQPFKYWKKNKQINKQQILEEFVDAIHFFVSLGDFFQISTIVEAKVLTANPTNQLLHIFNSISDFFSDQRKENLEKAFSLYMGMAKLLNITKAQILESYNAKNQINFERISNNY